MTEAKQHTLSDPASPVFGVLATAVMGAIALIDVSTLDDRQRRTAHIGTAAVTGLYIGVTIGGKHTPVRVVAGLAAAAAALRFADLADTIDARLEEYLRRTGTRHPRRWMAAGTAVVTFAGFLSDRAAAKEKQVTAMWDNSSEQVRSLDPRVRELIEGILDATDIIGARELREQLAVAQEIFWSDEFISTVYFAVPPGMPRAVPHDQIFPVRARLNALDGATYQLVLYLSDGYLNHLAVEPLVPQDVEPLDSLLAGWPNPSDVVHVLDSSDGTKVL